MSHNQPDHDSRQDRAQPPTPYAARPTPRPPNDHHDAQAAVLLNEFLSKTRPLVCSELGNEMTCTLCSEGFLRGGSPEVAIKLRCGHVFGMNCILKWLSPVSRDGNNSCPNCRTPVFDDWDRMHFPAPRPLAPAGGRTILAPPVQTPVVHAYRNIAPFRARTPPAVTAASNDPTATGSSVSAAPETVSLNARLLSRAAATRDVQDRQPQAVVTNASRASETSTPDDTAPSVSFLRPRRVRRAASIGEREWEEAMSTRRLEEVAQMRENFSRSREIRRYRGARYELYSNAPAPARGPAIPAAGEAAAPAEDGANSIATILAAAEAAHVRQSAQAATVERKRYLWLQFREGVVRAIEQSDDASAWRNHDVALTIIAMDDLDGFLAELAGETQTWRRILATFTRLCTELAMRFDDFRPLVSVDIDDRIELERRLASTSFDMATVHKSRWYTRLSERVARREEAAVARLTEQVAGLSGGTVTPGVTGSGERRLAEEWGTEDW